MPITWLTGYGPSNLEALLALVAAGALVAGGYWLLRCRWQRDLHALDSALAEARRREEGLQGELAEERRERELDEARHEGELDEARARYDPARIRVLQDHLERVIAHEFVKGLHFIGTQSAEVAAGLRGDQADLRLTLHEVGAKAHEMTQHSRNIVGLSDLERKAPQREMVNLRGLMERVLKELFPYAEARNVHLQVEYGTLEPMLTNRLLVHQVFSNVAHNAVKYSPDNGSVVKIALRLDEDGAKRAVIEVRDYGRGIEARDQERVFELHVRGDGLVEPGSGLGLYYARTAARLLGGDVALAVSKVNEGSTFQIILPYDECSDAPPAGDTSKGEAP